jgi:hypothetical protein
MKTTPLDALIASVMNAAAQRLKPAAPLPPKPPTVQRRNPERNEGRQILRTVGRRQWKKMQRGVRT